MRVKALVTHSRTSHSRSQKTLTKHHCIVRSFVVDQLPLGREPLYTNNHNRQMMIDYELFRQTAEAMLDDGGPVVAEEMMKAVIKEMHEHLAKREQNLMKTMYLS